MRPLSLTRALRHCYVVLALRLSDLVRQGPARTQVQGERQPEAPHPDEQTDAPIMEIPHEEKEQDATEVHGQPEEGQRLHELRSESQEGTGPDQSPQTLKVISFTPKTREGGDAALLSSLDDVRKWITDNPNDYESIYIALWRKGKDPRDEGFPERALAGFTSTREIVGFLQLHLDDLIHDARPR